MNNEIEVGSFIPLVFSTLRGGMGHAALVLVTLGIIKKINEKVFMYL